MKFALTELFKIAADPFKNHTPSGSTTFVAPAKATARVVGVIQPSFIQKWFTFKVIDPNKNPLANAALGLVTEKLIDTVIPFLARGLWKVVTILPGKVKFAVSGTLTIVTAVNYVLRTVIPTGLLSTLTEFPQTVRATAESIQQTVTNSAVVTNTVKELAGTVKMYTSTNTTTQGVSVPAKGEAVSSTVLPSIVETAQKTTEIAAGHGWLYYAGWITIATLSIGAIYYGYTFYSKNSETLGDALLSEIDTGHGGWLDYVADKMDHLPTFLKKPLENLILGDWSQIWNPDSFYPVATKAATGVTLAGIGSLFTWKFWKPKQMGYTEKELNDIAEATEQSLKIKPKSSGTVTLPPELVNASPEEKAAFLREAKNKLPEISRQDIANELLKLDHAEQMAITQTETFQSLIGNDNFLVYKSLQEVVNSPDHMAAIVQIFMN